MPTYYYECSTCDSMFVSGQKVTISDNNVCLAGRCNIKELTREEADEAVEEMRNEKSS